MGEKGRYRGLWCEGVKVPGQRGSLGAVWGRSRSVFDMRVQPTCIGESLDRLHFRPSLGNAPIIVPLTRRLISGSHRSSDPRVLIANHRGCCNH